MQRLNVAFNDLYDITAVRVIVETERQCYEVLGIIHSLFKPIPGRFKDYIAMPKGNGYKSLHTSVIGPKQKPLEVQRKWYIVDAANKPLGRVATTVANILRGKHLPTFTPHADCGDHVIIINCEKAVLTGKKFENKTYYRHTGWIGGLKETKYSDMNIEISSL